MKNNRLVRKLTLSIIALFVFILLIQLFIQNSVLVEVYAPLKEQQVTKQFDKAVAAYKSSNDVNELDSFVDATNAAYAIFDMETRRISSSFLNHFSHITLRSNDMTYKVLVHDMVDDQGLYFNSAYLLSPKEDIHIEGYVLNEGIIIPTVLMTDKYSITFDRIQGDYAISRKVQVDGNVDEQNLYPRESGIYAYQYDKLLIEIENMFYEHSLNETTFNEMVTEGGYSYLDDASGLTYVVYIKPLQDEKYATSLIVIEDLTESFAVLNEFYLYFFIFQIFLVILLATLFAKWVTKPLLALIKTASSIAKLDFSTKSSVKSNDELGDLSSSLNDISSNLSTTIDNLESSKEALTVQNKVIADSEERMRTMLASLSHDMKTPLSVIGGFVEVLKDKAYDKDPAYYLSVIEEEVDMLTSLVDETLLLTRLESKAAPLNPTMTDIDALITRVIDKHVDAINEGNYRVALGKSELFVMLDTLKIEQVVTNLLSNAIKYSQKGSQISISSSLEDQVFILKVHNAGASIDPEDLEHIWDRFYRSDKGRSRDISGHGLGLTIVKNIVELHEGSYTMRNNKGVEVIIRIPLTSKE